MTMFFNPLQPEWHLKTAHLVKEPSEFFRSSIACAYQLKFDAEFEKSTILAGIPDGCLDILFSLDGDPSDCFILPSTKERCEFIFKTNTEYFGLRLLPLQTLFSFDLSLLEIYKYRKIPLFDVSPNLLSLYDVLLYVESLEQRLTCVEAFLLKNNSSYLLPSHTIKNCLHLAFHNKGRAKVNDLEALTGYSTRYLRILFQQEVGISPKAFLDMVYFQFTLKELMWENFSLEQHLLEYGIYDVSHFYKKFKKISMMTPREYLEKIKIN